MTESHANLVAVIQAGWTPPVDMTLPKYKKIGWFQAARMEYIGFFLQAHGQILPVDLMNRFSISIITARDDITNWQIINHPLEKCARRKSYERTYYKDNETAKARC